MCGDCELEALSQGAASLDLRYTITCRVSFMANLVFLCSLGIRVDFAGGGVGVDAGLRQPVGMPVAHPFARAVGLRALLLVLSGFVLFSVTQESADPSWDMILNVFGSAFVLQFWLVIGFPMRDAEHILDLNQHLLSEPPATNDLGCVQSSAQRQPFGISSSAAQMSQSPRGIARVPMHNDKALRAAASEIYSMYLSTCPSHDGLYVDDIAALLAVPGWLG